MNLSYKEELCHCKKSKYIDVQCPYKRKENSHFCGIHIKSNIKYIYSEVLKNGILDENGDIIVSISQNENELQKEKCMEDECVEESVIEIENNKIYENKEEFLRDLFENKYKVSMYTLRKSMKKIGFKICTKQSRRILYNELKKIYDFEIKYINHISQIIKVQSVVRKHLVYRLRLCKNDSDILTFENTFHIPFSNIYIYKDKITNFRYCFDIRTLYHLLQMPNPQCPYTGREYKEEEIILLWNDIENYKRRGIHFEMEKKEMTEEERVEMYMMDVFYKINLLDNYTSHIWFKNLNRTQLLQLYLQVIDIWFYRLQLTKKERKKYVENGRALQTSYHELQNITTLPALQTKILDEFHRFLVEGKTREDRKLSCLWLLSALVEVSEEAREALPFL